MDDPSPPEETEGPEKTTIRPADPWPVYNVCRARAELIALELLTRGVSRMRVRHATKLSSTEVSRLAKIVAEDARNPHPPRIVGRTPPRLPAGAIPRQRPPAPAEEPEQMTFSLDC
ncbi:hypothetical protein ACIQVO_38795 [Streptomyces sp. NPDC101062]|uniref:hypothetical protein n=1 Tax=unclassified Streptomyces TaxID=2593676 RepID=UPI00380B51FA